MEREEVFSSPSYKEYVNRRLARLPSQGRGQLRKMAAHMRVQPSLVSQVFNGPKHLTLEQASRCSEFLNLSELASEYFLALVQMDRTESDRMKKLVKNQLKRLETFHESEQSALRIQQGGLDASAQAQYYSSWHFVGLHILASLPGLKTRAALSRHLGLPLTYVDQVTGFLVESGLLRDTRGVLEIGQNRTKAEKGSSFSTRHQMNWRVKAIDFLPRQTPIDLFYSFPMSISRTDAELIRKKLLDLICEVGQRVESSEPQLAYCLNLDWFQWS